MLAIVEGSPPVGRLGTFLLPLALLLEGVHPDFESGYPGGELEVGAHRASEVGLNRVMLFLGALKPRVDFLDLLSRSERLKVFLGRELCLNGSASIVSVTFLGIWFSVAGERNLSIMESV